MFGAKGRLKILHPVRDWSNCCWPFCTERSGESQAVANHLSVAKSNAIRKLHPEGRSRREIAAALNVDRKTVWRHLALKELVDEAAISPRGAPIPPGAAYPKCIKIIHQNDRRS